MLAYLFHWAPESLLRLTAADLKFWAERVENVKNALKRGSENG